MMEADLTNEAPDEVELAVGELYKAFFRLRQSGKHQEEYDAMGVIISLLSQDRDYLRRTGKVKI